MMAEAADIAVFRALSLRLNGATGAGTNIYQVYVPENKIRPYILCQIQSQGERSFHLRKQDPEFVMLIKAVSDAHDEARTIAQQALELLDDQGEQDLAGLSGGTDWYLLKAMVEEHIRMTYKNGTTRIFEEGFQLRIVLQEK